MTNQTTPSERAGQLTAEERERYGRIVFETDFPPDGGEFHWETVRAACRADCCRIAEAVIAAFLEDHPRDDAGERGAAMTRRLAATIAAYRETVAAALADSGDADITETICETEQHLDDDARLLVASVPETYHAVLDWLDHSTSPLPGAGEVDG